MVLANCGSGPESDKYIVSNDPYSNSRLGEINSSDDRQVVRQASHLLRHEFWIKLDAEGIIPTYSAFEEAQIMIENAVVDAYKRGKDSEIYIIILKENLLILADRINQAARSARKQGQIGQNLTAIDISALNGEVEVEFRNASPRILHPDRVMRSQRDDRGPPRPRMSQIDKSDQFSGMTNTSRLLEITRFGIRLCPPPPLWPFCGDDQ